MSINRSCSATSSSAREIVARVAAGDALPQPGPCVRARRSRRRRRRRAASPRASEPAASASRAGAVHARSSTGASSAWSSATTIESALPASLSASRSWLGRVAQRRARMLGERGGDAGRWRTCESTAPAMVAAEASRRRKTRGCSASARPGALALDVDRMLVQQHLDLRLPASPGGGVGPLRAAARAADGPIAAPGGWVESRSLVATRTKNASGRGATKGEPVVREVRVQRRDAARRHRRARDRRRRPRAARRRGRPTNVTGSARASTRLPDRRRAPRARIGASGQSVCRDHAVARSQRCGDAAAPRAPAAPAMASRCASAGACNGRRPVGAPFEECRQ